MRTFWICVGVIIALLCSAFVGGSIYAYSHNYSNIVDWIKDWSVFKDSEKTEEKTEIELPEDSTQVTAVITL